MSNVRGGGIERNVSECPKTQDYNKMAYSVWAVTRTKRCPSTVGQCCFLHFLYTIFCCQPLAAVPVGMNIEAFVLVLRPFVCMCTI